LAGAAAQEQLPRSGATTAVQQSQLPSVWGWSAKQWRQPRQVQESELGRRRRWQAAGEPRGRCCSCQQ